MSTGNPPPQKKSAAPKILIGCLVAFILMALIVCGIGYYIATNIKTLGVNFIAGALTQVIDQSQLPEDQKVGMKEQIERVSTGYKSGEISDEQLGKIFENLNESPVISAIPVIVVQAAYLQKSGLTDEEKAEAKKQLDRVAHGLFEKTITPEQLDPAMEKIAHRDAEGKWEIEDEVTDEQLKEFIAEITKISDENNIPNEDFKVDIVAELKKAIDNALEK